MAGDYPDWDMSDQTRAQLRAGLDGALYAGVPGGDDVDAVVEHVGKDQLLQAMSGTADKSSREWKNARDNLSRWRRGARTPNRESQDKMRAAAEDKRRGEVRDARSVHVRYNATFRTSPPKKWVGYADADLTGSQLDDFLAAQAGGDSELAAQIVADAYGLDPEFVLGIEDLEGFDIQW